MLPEMFERITRYNRFKNIFDGKHEEAWSPALPNDNAPYVIQPIGALMTRVYADLLFGGDNDKPPFSVRLITEDQSQLQALTTFESENSDLYSKLHEAAMSASVYGDCVIELYREEGEDGQLGRVHFGVQDPRLWEPFQNQRGTDWSKHITRRIRQPYPDREEYFIIEKEHTPNGVKTIVYEAHGDEALTSKSTWKEVSGAGKLKEMGISVFQQDHNIGMPLLIHTPNMRFPGSLYGISDYQDKESLMQMINQLTSLAQYAIERNSDPHMAVDQRFIEALEVDPAYYPHPDDLGKWFGESEDSKGLTRYITWDGNITALFEQRQHLIDMLFMYAELAPGILGQDSGGSIPESGRALEIKYARTLSAIYRRQRYWEQSLEHLYKVAMRLLGAEGEIELEVTFNTSVAQTTKDVLEDAALLKASGVLSNEEVIRRTLSKLDYTPEEIENEVRQLQGESSIQSLASGSESPSNEFAKSFSVTA